jgi:AcrR family transcriptional regulator
VPAPARPTTAPERPGARARLLDAARVVFARDGINATGVAELCGEARVSKRSLYMHFASKDELVAGYLSELAADPGYPPHAVLTRGDLAPRARLLELYTTLADGPRPLRGCPFVNAGTELADANHPARPIIVTYKEEFADRLSALAREAGARGSERLGRQLALLYDGAAARVALFNRPEPAAEAQALAAGLLRAVAD